MEHILIMLKFKREKPNYNNWHKSQNKNSSLFQALLPKRKNYHICPKLENYVGLATLKTIRPIQKIHQHRQIFQIYYKHRTRRSITPNTGQNVQSKWSYLLKHLNTPSQQLLSFNYNPRQRSYKLPWKCLLNFMSNRMEKWMEKQIFWSPNQNNKRFLPNKLRPQHRRKYLLYLHKILLPVNLPHQSFRALLSLQRPIKGRNCTRRPLLTATNLQKTFQHVKWSYSKLELL